MAAGDANGVPPCAESRLACPSSCRPLVPEAIQPKLSLALPDARAIRRGSELATRSATRPRSDLAEARGHDPCASEGWRARQDSNLRPLAPEANALSS